MSNFGCSSNIKAHCTLKMLSHVQQHGVVVNRAVTEPDRPIMGKDLRGRV